jgi:hypothetical protein
VRPPSAPEDLPRAIAAWRKRMKVWALLLLFLGLGLLMAGAVWLGRTTSLGGFWLGSLGVFSIVMGAFFGRLAAAGPLPKHLLGEPR